MSTGNKSGTTRPLNPANAGLEGQSRVNAEIFTAVEILGRKLERSEAERDRLARRLALIESAATLDEKTGKFYLPVVVDQEMPPHPGAYATPKWMVAASLMSSAIALFALGLVLFREPAPVLSKEQLAVLNTLKGPQFAALASDNGGWKHPEAEAEQQINAVPEPHTVVEPEVATITPEPPPSLTATLEPPKEIPAVVPPTVAAAPVPPAPVAETEPQMPDTAVLTPVEKTAALPKPPAAAPAPMVAPAPPEPPKVVAEKPVVAPPAPEKAAAVVNSAPAKPVKEDKTKPLSLTTPPPAETSAAEPPAADSTLPEKLSQLEKRAYEGIPEAQHDLATIYASGKLVAQDYPRAIHWFTKAAEGGVGNAHYNLGVIYHQGLGVRPDMEKALSWYEKAAELGHPEAMYNLGIAYVEGIGTTANIEKGVSYFKRAAKAGVAQAAYNLGVLYESNFVGPIDTDKAQEWYQVAANQGHADAREAIIRIKSGTAAASDDQALSLADMVEPAAGENGEGDSSPSNEPGQEAAAQKNILTGIQQELIRQGLLPGPADGVRTQQVEDAIRSYQKKLGWTEDGEPTQKFLNALLLHPTAPE